MTPDERFRATLTDSKIDALEVLAVAGTLAAEGIEARAAEIAEGATLTEEQRSRLEHIVTMAKTRAGLISEN